VQPDEDARTARDVLTELGLRGGGPRCVAVMLAAAGAIDELLLTVAPLLAAGDARAILEGEALAEPARLALRSVHRAGDHLFLRYARST